MQTFFAGDDPLDIEHESFFTLDRLPVLPKRWSEPVYGEARLANAADLGGYLNPPDEDYPCCLRDACFLLEANDGHGHAALYKRPFYLPAEDRRRNLLIVGQTGSGKTQRPILPLAISDIEDPKSSVVLVDLKGDLHQKLLPFVQRHRPGTPVHVLNLTDPRRSTVAWSPFAGRRPEDTALEDADLFCQAAHSPNSDHDSPFWDGSAARWLAAIRLCLHRLHGRVCLADLHHALELPNGELRDLLGRFPDAPFAPGVRSYLANDSHNAHTVLATAQMHLRALRDPCLAAVTSKNTLRFADLFRRPALLVIELNDGKVEVLRPYVNLLFGQLFRAITRFCERQPGNRLPRPLNLYLDDFATAIGRIPGFGASLNTLRSRDVRVTAAVQSLSQIEDFYGTEAGSVISGFATKIFQAPVELHDAEWASRQSGQCTVEAAELTQEPEPDGSFRTVTRTLRPVGRPLLLPDSIRLAPEHFALGRAATVFLPEVPPFYCWFRPGHQVPALAKDLAEAARQPRARSLRRHPLRYRRQGVSNPRPANTPPGITDTTGWSIDQLSRRLAEVRSQLGWSATTAEHRRWWEAFESENRERLPLVVRLAEELLVRKATVTDFFLAYVHSNTDNIQANLHYLDYTRLKKEEETRKKKKK